MNISVFLLLSITKMEGSSHSSWQQQSQFCYCKWNTEEKKIPLASGTRKESKSMRKTWGGGKEKEGSKHQGTGTLLHLTKNQRNQGRGEVQRRDSRGGRVRGPSRMTAAQFELLKCRRELLSSPFRVTVHVGKGPVILLSLPHTELLPSSSRFPPNGATAPRESPDKHSRSNIRAKPRAALQAAES